MRLFAFCRSLLVLCGCTGILLTAQSLVPEVQEKRLANGLRILAVARPGTGAVHARLFLRNGSARTGDLPPVAAELLARCLFGPPLDGEANRDAALAALLKWEEGTYESLRIARIQRSRRAPVETDPDLEDLELLHRQALDSLRARETMPVASDPFVGTATQTTLQTEADFIAYGVDLPIVRFELYAHILSSRLKSPLLGRFPIERMRMMAALRTGGDEKQGALNAFLATALSGHPYAQVANAPVADVESLTWSAMRGYAGQVVVPGKMVLVLVGDANLQDLLPALERTFGALSPGGEETTERERVTDDLLEGSGVRRLQASVPGGMYLLMGWRVPPVTHPDHPALEVLVQMLGGGHTARLSQSLMGDRRLAKSLAVRLNVPGGKDPNLLLIEAQPEERHGLAELEQSIQSELIRLQRGAFSEGEIRKAQRQVEVGMVMAQEDAAELAQVLGTAACQGGDWRSAFRALSVKRDYTQQEIQAIALKYLLPEQSIVAFYETDPALMPLDPIERRTGEVLKRILTERLGEPGQVESLVREALRQLRMLPRPQREQTLKLLEGQVKP